MKEDVLIGRKLGSYQLQRLLGRGGMARVYYAWDESLERPAAMKVIDVNWRGEKSYAQRFVQEAKAVAQWRHNNIIQVYYAGQEGDLYFFAMEYVDGFNLEQLLEQCAQRGELMPHEDVLHIGGAVAGALDYAHDKRVIHRDVKPSNVMINQENRVVLTDFGLALDTNRGSVGETLGTPHYVAPEQAMHSADAVAQSDLYSLGVMLYEMLTGMVPFDDESSMSLALKHLTEAPPLPRSINPKLNEATEKVLLKALAKEPADRYDNGAALLTALTEALDDIKVNGPLMSPLPPPPVGTQTIAVGALSEMAPAQRMRLSAPMAPPPLTAAAATPPTVKKTSEKGSGWFGRFLLAFLLFLLVVGGGVFLVPGGRDLPIVRQLSTTLGLPVAAESAATPTPTVASASPTATLPLATAAMDFATETAVAMVVAETATATSTRLPTETATALVRATETATIAVVATVADTIAATAEPTVVVNTATPTPLPMLIRAQDRMNMVPIPATTFMMGAADEDILADEDERPLHEVTLSPFYIDQYEVSVSQYISFLNTLPPRDGVAAYVGGCNGNTCLHTQFETVNSHVMDTIEGWKAEAGFGEHPISSVSWYGATAYCEWVGARLPTEAEWELVAQGENGRLYPWGDEGPTRERAVFDTNFAALAPVSALPDGVSPYALYHMAGNVWEWVADSYDANYYEESPSLDPLNEAVTAVRVQRGGGYAARAEELRTTNRRSADATQREADVGFRCAQTMP